MQCRVVSQMRTGAAGRETKDADGVKTFFMLSKFVKTKNHDHESYWTPDDVRKCSRQHVHVAEQSLQKCLDTFHPVTESDSTFILSFRRRSDWRCLRFVLSAV